jgi:hypothetical protein
VLLESRDMARVSHAPTQAVTGPFRRWQWSFLFGLYILCLFTVYLCNGLILYGFLGGFMLDQTSYL